MEYNSGDILFKQEVNDIVASFKINVGISSKHVYLTQEHIEILFGAGHILEKEEGLESAWPVY